MYIAVEVMGISISAYAALLICVWIPITFCTIALVIKDAYDGVNEAPGRNGTYNTWNCGIIYDCICCNTNRNLEKSANNCGMITNIVGHIFNGVCMLTMSMVYWIKQYLNKKSYKED